MKKTIIILSLLVLSVTNSFAQKVQVSIDHTLIDYSRLKHFDVNNYFNQLNEGISFGFVGNPEKFITIGSTFNIWQEFNSFNLSDKHSSEYHISTTLFSRFNLVKQTSHVVPFVDFGTSVPFINDKFYFLAKIGGGSNFWFSKNIGLNLEANYNGDFNDNGFVQYNAGIVLRHK